MNLERIDPPRCFAVNERVTLAHCANLELHRGERVTFATEGVVDYSMLRTAWGFVSDLPLEAGAAAAGLEAALSGAEPDRVHLLLVEPQGLEACRSYCEAEGHRLVARLSEPASIARLEGLDL